VLKSASPMLPCAEDLGVVPDYVSPTLGELSILSLCVLRWRHRGAVLESPRDYSFLSVATPSVHDSSNLREWLRDEGSRYFPGDDALHSALAAIYDSASVLALVPIQDLLALDAALHGSPEKERINVPGTVSEKNWSYRIPLFLEDLIKREGLNQQVRILTARRSTKQVPGQ
jgi:4-alpha-glucanotransferase